MGIWAKRDFSDPSYLDCYEVMRRQARQGHQGLLMIAKPIEGNDYSKTTIYICLPNRDLLVNYPGFEEIDAASLPEEAVLIHGDRQLFSARFKYRRAWEH
jgi:hypothetical protein